MITRAQWDVLTPQQQWDHVVMLDHIVDEYEAALDGEGEDAEAETTPRKRQVPDQRPTPYESSHA